MDESPSLDEARLVEIFRALHAHGVEYAVFGAVALGLHGLARATGDVDLFIRPDAENIERLKTGLRSVFDDPCIRPLDRFGAAVLAERFGLEKK